MPFWRTFGYVARRIGRECLIWGGLLVPVYVVADQYLFHRYQQKLQAWDRQEAEIYPVITSPVVDCPPLDTLPAVLERMESIAQQYNATAEIKTGHLTIGGYMHFSRLGWAQDDVHDARVLSPETLSFNRTTGELERAVAREAVAITAHLHELNDCDFPMWPAFPPPDYLKSYLDVFGAEFLLLQMTPYMGEEGNVAECTAALIASARMIDPRQTPYQAWLDKHWLEAIHIALDQNAIAPEGIRPLCELLSRKRLKTFTPTRFVERSNFAWDELPLYGHRWAAHPWMKRMARPLIIYEISQVLDLRERLSEIVEMNRIADRMAAYHAVLSENTLSIRELNLAVKQLVARCLSYERRCSEIDMLQLMLTLEEIRYQQGAYPSQLEHTSMYSAENFQSLFEADQPITYSCHDDGLGYRITRKLSIHDIPTYAPYILPSPSDRVWIRRYEARRE